MWVPRKYFMSRIIQKFHSTENNNFPHLAVPDYFKFKWQKYELEWWCLIGIDEMMNGRDELWRWVQLKYVLSQIIQKLYSIEKQQLLIPFCLLRCFIKLTKLWMGLMQYGGECTRNMPRVESYENCIKLIYNELTMLKCIKIWIFISLYSDNQKLRLNK